MRSSNGRCRLGLLFGFLGLGIVAQAIAIRADCTQVVGLQPRSASAADASVLVRRWSDLGARARQRAIAAEVLAGNVPSHLRSYHPVSFDALDTDGVSHSVTICVSGDYLAVGSDHDNLRVPLTMPSIGRLIRELDVVLPTAALVDRIYAAAGVHLTPRPRPPGPAMRSLEAYQGHHQTIERQLRQHKNASELLIAGHKKDVVIVKRLRQFNDRIAIYGWHHKDGDPIQPVSTVHGATYADYSHGVRLVAQQIEVDHRKVELRDIAADSRLWPLVAKRGPFEIRLPP